MVDVVPAWNQIINTLPQGMSSACQGGSLVSNWESPEGAETRVGSDQDPVHRGAGRLSWGGGSARNRNLPLRGCRDLGALS